MQARVTTRVNIAADPAAVFKYLADLKYHYLWNPQIQSIEPITRLKLGSTYKTNSVVLGVRINAQNKVTRFAKDREIELINTTGMVKYRANFKLYSKPHKTEVICKVEVSSDSSAYAFATPVLKLLARRELQIDLQSLKLAVEHGME